MTSKKHMLDMKVKHVQRLSATYALLRLAPANGAALPYGIMPGQFLQIEIPDSKNTFLRRPISICLADYQKDEIWLLVRNAGQGTAHLVDCHQDDVFNVLFPLGHGFTIPKEKEAKVALVGGGVGVAPLLYLGKMLKEKGMKPTFILGARSKSDLLLLDEFGRYGQVCVSTDDGTAGEKGLVISNSAFESDYDLIACCGPTPMMKAVAALASARGIECEVSLENMMACGLGACLCCVEDTADGNVCVCKEGPVFNINLLKWQI